MNHTVKETNGIGNMLGTSFFFNIDSGGTATHTECSMVYEDELWRRVEPCSGWAHYAVSVALCFNHYLIIYLLEAEVLYKTDSTTLEVM